MGRRKKFIDKKNSATFQLLARDSSDPNASTDGGDRVFVRVDNNPYPSHGFFDDDDDDDEIAGIASPRNHAENLVFNVGGPDSIFADAPGDEDDNFGGDRIGSNRNPAAGRLHDDVRREILELGFPDDGYNYLIHLREIKNVGGGSSFYHNPKAKLDRVPLDVKAYDASRLRIHAESSGGNSSSNLIYSVSSKTVGVKIHKAVDPDVAALLDDSDLSRFGSDVEDLEEDFVVKANLSEDRAEEDDSSMDEQIKLIKGGQAESISCPSQEAEVELICGVDLKSDWLEGGDEGGSEKPRVKRLLDEQFDLLTLREYGSDGDDAGSFAAENEPLASKLNNALKHHAIDDIVLEDKYRVPADFFHGNGKLSEGKQVDSPTDVIRKCVEFAEMYSHENEDGEDVIVVQESSDESEVWDCETIVSTYSNLDNHPGKIQAPERPRRKLATIVSGASNNNNNVISLRGKEKLPVEFLPHTRKNVMERAKKVPTLGADQQKQKRRPSGEESKEEKKERKSAVKEERREARRAKKELKGFYKGETQRAQKVAAISGPCSIHLM